MLGRLQQVLLNTWPDTTFDDRASCHHNYVAEEHHYGEDLLITRRG